MQTHKTSTSSIHVDNVVHSFLEAFARDSVSISPLGIHSDQSRRFPVFISLSLFPAATCIHPHSLHTLHAVTFLGQLTIIHSFPFLILHPGNNFFFAETPADDRHKTVHLVSHQSVCFISRLGDLLSSGLPQASLNRLSIHPSTFQSAAVEPWPRLRIRTLLRLYLTVSGGTAPPTKKSVSAFDRR